MTEMSRDKPNKDCFYYWFFEPLKAHYKDDGSLRPALEIPIDTRFGKCELALFLDSEGSPNYARFVIPGFVTEELKQGHIQLIQLMREHILSVLRIIYDPTIQLTHYAMWGFSEINKPPLDVSIRQLQGQLPTFPSVAIHNFFVATWSERIEIKLWADALDERIPLQYRYLSLFKILEHHFKKRGKWQDNELSSYLGQFSTEFGEIGGNHTLMSYIHALRDKCAHIATGKGVTGVTQLSQQQSMEVQEFLPLMEDICAKLLNSVSNGKFTLVRLSRGQSRSDVP